jgi:hypothetical protein
MNDDLFQLRRYINSVGHEVIQYRQRRATMTNWGDAKVYAEWTDWQSLPVVRERPEPPQKDTTNG